ncbi:MAG: helix-hairpin-helix domain-containing protein [Gammaproteobacteria bacterium]
MAILKQLSLAALISLSPLLAVAGSVDINKADAATLAKELTGVGDAKANAIIAYRDQHGPFKTVDDLVLVDGIGEKTVAANRDKLTVEPASEPQPAK